MTYEEILSELNGSADAGYKAFNSRIIRTNYPTIGVRTPVIVGLSKIIVKQYPEFIDDFLSRHTFTFEELSIAALVCGSIKDYTIGRDTLMRILPRFDNWSVVDQSICRQSYIKKNVSAALKDFDYLLSDDSYFGGEFYKRTYVMILFDFCLNDDYIDIAIEKLLSVPFGDYYVDMAAAWLLSAGIIKYYDKVIPLLEAHTFPPFVMRKTVSKCRDSYRVTDTQKEYLKSLL